MTLAKSIRAQLLRMEMLMNVFLVDMLERNKKRPFWQRYTRPTNAKEAWVLADKLLTAEEKQGYLDLFHDELDRLALLEDLIDVEDIYDELRIQFCVDVPGNRC